jgi:hypothetical protein
MPPSKRPLPDVPVPMSVAAIKAGMNKISITKEQPPKLQKAAVIQRSKGTEIRKEGRVKANEVLDIERAKAQHYTDAAKMLREKAVEIRKSLAAKKKVTSEIKKVGKKPSTLKKPTVRAEAGETAAGEVPVPAAKAAKKLGVTVPPAAKPKIAAADIKAFFGGVGKNPFLHQ